MISGEGGVAAATYLCTLPPAPARGAMKRSAWFYLVQRSVYDRLGHVDQMHDSPLNRKVLGVDDFVFDDVADIPQV